MSVLKFNRSIKLWNQLPRLASARQCSSGANRDLKIGVVGVPFWTGQSKMGTELAPDHLRAFGLMRKLNDISRNVIDYGNLHFDTANPIPYEYRKINNRNEWMCRQMHNKLCDFVREMHWQEENSVAVVVGGDHSIAIGSVNGTCAALDTDISLIWIDAHADANTEHSSNTGNFHGMPVSFLVKDFPTPKRALFEDVKPCLSAKNIVYIALRDVELQELRLLKELKIAHFTMRDVDRLGIDAVISRALDIVDPHSRNRFHVSFDVDSVDNLYIPSTGTPVIGGLTVREAFYIGEKIFATGRLSTLDVVEFNPNIGTKAEVQRSANYIIDIVTSFLGKSRMGNYCIDEEE